MYRSLQITLKKEIEELDRTVDICLKRSARRAEFTANNAEDILADSLSACLHSFYNGLENIFESIALELDEGTPKGDRWHKKLLRQMTAEVPGIRCQVLSEEGYVQLENFRAFRHLFRNLYTHNLIPERVFSLASSLAATWATVGGDLESFLNFLEGVDGSKDT